MKKFPFILTLIGHGILAVFTVFLFMGPFFSVELSLGAVETLLFDAGLCLAFFLQHSVMIRKGVRGRIARWLPRRYFGALFSLTSSVVLFLFMLLWQESPVPIASADGIFRWVLHLAFFLAVAGQIRISRSLGETIDVFGAKALARPADSGPAPPAPILAKGPYAWVRHPAYFTTLILIWAYPDPAADRLLMNLLFTAWILIGILLEERDLVRIHGEAYRAYQRTVPALIPYRFPPRQLG